MTIQFFRAPHLDVKDVATAVEDFLLAGVHTTAYTSAFLLHHVACNPDAQLRLAKESRAILNSATGPNLSRYWSPQPRGTNTPKNTRTDLAAATYARAVLWESLRLSPVAVGAGRILDQSAVLGGFLVPKGTVVVAMNQVSKSQNNKTFSAPTAALFVTIWCFWFATVTFFLFHSADILREGIKNCHHSLRQFQLL